MDDYTSSPSTESKSINTNVTTLKAQLSGLPITKRGKYRKGLWTLVTWHCSPK